MINSVLRQYATNRIRGFDPVYKIFTFDSNKKSFILYDIDEAPINNRVIEIAMNRN